MTKASKKGYNWRARQVVQTVIDDSDTKKIQLDFDVSGSYDNSNQLVLPSKKRKTKIKHEKSQSTRILSKKQRKKLEKVLEKKKKKENRENLLEELSKVQATPEELEKLTPISFVQTKGLKKHFSEIKSGKDEHSVSVNEDNSQQKERVLNTIKGSKRKRIILYTQNNKKLDNNANPNIVGFSSSSSESENDEDCKEESNQKKQKLEQHNEQLSLKIQDKEADKIDENNKEEDNVSEKNHKDEKESANTDDKIKQQNSTTNLKIERKPAIFVEVNRDAEVQKARLKLPILAEEQEIMEKINENSIIILAGETGSGKTTQIPQFLYEAGYALKKMIAITEPRRVAAISMSRRVAQEMNLTSREVSYLIRFEGNVTEDTKIKFMTDGVLLKEIQSDFLLMKYSVVILDEAHERSVYTDILIGLLSRIVPLRKKRGDPLKLIIMSATLRLQDFTENKRLFKVTPPLIKIDTRQFPVTVHFNKKTYEDYLKEAFSKVSKIHMKLPDGGILVFVTGQQEVNTLVRKLRKAFPLKQRTTGKQSQMNNEKNQDANNVCNDSSDSELEKKLKRTLKVKKKTKTIPEINLDDFSIPGDHENSEDEEYSEEESDSEVIAINNTQPLWVLPLYSMLPSQKQTQVFEPPPEGCRLCVVSTNVAETSLTIPNIKYVVDTGKAKVKMYDKVTGVTSYAVTWTSKASASQRAGRAGRIGPGHCYRLYSSAVFNDLFQEFSIPEIQQKPIDDLYLQMKCMNIQKVANFPFPSAPDLLQLNMAAKRLMILEAIKDNKVTPLGYAISKFPVLPRFGKMLAISHQQDLLPYTICLVSALSVQEVLLEVPIGQVSTKDQKDVLQKWMGLRRQWAGSGNSILLGDATVLLRAVGAAEYASLEGKLEKFCAENGLRYKAIVEIRKLRLQLTNEIKINVPDADLTIDLKLEPLSDLQAKLLRQILLSGMGDQVAKKIMPEDLKEEDDRVKFKYAYRANSMEEPVFLHQGSVLRKTLPEYVIYQEIYETNKMYMRGVTAIEPEWLPIYVPNLCQLSDPLLEPEPYYEPKSDKIFCTVTGTFGTQAWPIPNVNVEYPETADAYKWFARFFLEGQVFEKLKYYKNLLLSSPRIMVKSWAKLQPRTDSLLKVLISKRARSRRTLEEAWEEQPTFLLPEYLKWLPESAHSEVSLCWPPT